MLAVQLVLGGALLIAASSGFPLLGGGGGGGGDAAGGGGAAAPAALVAGAPRAKVDRFDSARAWRWLERQVGFGPRPAGSAASRTLAAALRRALPAGRLQALPDGLRNVVGRLPGRRPAVALAAHYDTKDVPGYLGANDGASGTAVLLELARVLRRSRPAGGPELRFLLFDGEESPPGSSDFYRDGLRGSRPYAARHARELRALILLDYVGERGLSLPRERGSDRVLWERLRSAAQRVGVGATFPNAVTSGEVLDDHTPFARAGVPSIDLIDFDFACFHLVCDDLSVVSQRSLDAVGEAVLELLRGL